MYGVNQCVSVSSAVVANPQNSTAIYNHTMKELSQGLFLTGGGGGGGGGLNSVRQCTI